MEPLWSPGVATDGNRWQIDCPSRPQKQAKTVATGCHRMVRRRSRFESGRGLKYVQINLFCNYRAPLGQGGARESARRSARARPKSPCKSATVRSTGAPPCCVGPRRSGRYRVNPKSLENEKISVAAAAGAERWGQVLGSRAWPHGPARLKWSGARRTQVGRTADESGSLMYTRARENRRVSAPLV